MLLHERQHRVILWGEQGLYLFFPFRNCRSLWRFLLRSLRLRLCLYFSLKHFCRGRIECVRESSIIKDRVLLSRLRIHILLGHEWLLVGKLPRAESHHRCARVHWPGRTRRHLRSRRCRLLLLAHEVLVPRRGMVMLLLHRRRRGDMHALEVSSPVRQGGWPSEARRRRMLGGETLEGFGLRRSMSSLEGLEFRVYRASMLTRA